MTEPSATGPSEFERLLADAAMEMAQRPTTPTTAQRAVTLARDLLRACDAAAVTVFETPSTSTVEASDVDLEELVTRHVQTGTGPTLSAFESGEAVYVPDLGGDDRWPEETARSAAQAGLRTAYAVPLMVGRDRPLAVLTLYSRSLDGFDEDDRSTADVIAVHTAIAVSDALEHDQLESALATRTTIGQATGIVMERWGLDAGAAFSVLTRLSQAENVKLREIALRIVETGSVHPS